MFKLAIPCTIVQGKRCVIVAIAPMQDPHYVLAGLMFEDGGGGQYPLLRSEFAAAEKNAVTLVEHKDDKGAALLYTAQGGKAI